MTSIHKHIQIALWATLVFGTILAFSSNVSAGEYVRVSPDLELYYEEAGTGTPIVFIPGWTSTSRFFTAQIEHFSKNYRAIAYDPRNRGRSSKTSSGNSRAQLGEDLKAFLDALSLKDVILVGWSGGCYQGYDYFRAHGTENTKAFICIDSPPKAIMSYDGDWAGGKSTLDFKPFYEGLANDTVKTIRDFIQSMVTRQMTEEEINIFFEEIMTTPIDIARYNFLEWFIYDVSEDIKRMDGKIPVLYVLSEPAIEPGAAWLTQNAPHTEVTGGFGLHMMFWEFPDKFNAALDAFLEKIK
jgi:non-heme chloroperoxidase